MQKNYIIDDIKVSEKQIEYALLFVHLNLFDWNIIKPGQPILLNVVHPMLQNYVVTNVDGDDVYLSRLYDGIQK